MVGQMRRSDKSKILILNNNHHKIASTYSNIGNKCGYIRTRMRDVIGLGFKRRSSGADSAESNLRGRGEPALEVSTASHFPRFKNSLGSKSEPQGKRSSGLTLLPIRVSNSCSVTNDKSPSSAEGPKVPFQESGHALTAAFHT